MIDITVFDEPWCNTMPDDIIVNPWLDPSINACPINYWDSMEPLEDLSILRWGELEANTVLKNSSKKYYDRSYNEPEYVDAINQYKEHFSRLCYFYWYYECSLPEGFEEWIINRAKIKHYIRSGKKVKTVKDVGKLVYTIQDIQIMLQLSRKAVVDLIKQDLFISIKTIGGTRISKPSFDAWIREYLYG